MRYTNRILISFSLFCSATVFAQNRPFDIFFDVLYWQATETVDWVLINDLNTPNQNISYKTNSFNFEPGVRLGVGYTAPDWNSKFYYTYYYANTTSFASGNLVSTFLGGNAVQNHRFFYNNGQLNFRINFNMLDCDLDPLYYTTC